MAMLNAKGQNGWFGWQDEPRLEYLKGRFARTTEVAEKKKIASEIQRVAFETATHAPLGQYISPAAVRSNVSGMLITPGVPLLWNMKKN
jgi:peptide/nickel transport system substrate-binding protein